MKWIYYIFSAYILLLSVIPCGDEQECTEGVASHQEVSTAADAHDHFAELCSPFCVCSCCNTSITLQQQTSFIQSFDQPEKKITGKETRYFYHSSSEIWQPPKV